MRCALKLLAVLTLPCGALAQAVEPQATPRTNSGVATATAGHPERFPHRIWAACDFERRLPDFGRWQDAMLNGESWMWHSLLGSSLNLGLLDPLECARAAERAYRSGDAPLPAAEGFIRQVIGWREYVWGLYRLRGRDWERMNALGARTRLPAAFWDGATKMRCLADLAGKVRDTAYAHHIERLMVLGNAMSLLRIHPDDVYEWFMELFIDAYDWVMVPNVYAMSQFAAGEAITTKPYVSGSNYLRRMSDLPAGEWMHDWDGLYWTFIDDHREVFQIGTRDTLARQPRFLTELTHDSCRIAGCEEPRHRVGRVDLQLHRCGFAPPKRFLKARRDVQGHHGLSSVQ